MKKNFYFMLLVVRIPFWYCSLTHWLLVYNMWIQMLYRCLMWQYKWKYMWITLRIFKQRWKFGKKKLIKWMATLKSMCAQQPSTFMEVIAHEQKISQHRTKGYEVQSLHIRQWRNYFETPRRHRENTMHSHRSDFQVPLRSSCGSKGQT